jgi:hypothetical protein
MKKTIFVIFLTTLMSGCASVKMESPEASNRAKQFATPNLGNSGLYIYRDSNLGAALKKNLWVDGKCIGESAPGVFFFTEVAGDKDHTVSTQSEFSPNKLTNFFASGKNYFIRQYIKLGVFIGGADLEVIPEEQGKSDVSKLALATTGTCSE